MKKILLLAALFIGMISCTTGKKNDYRVMTFNIRYDNPADGVNSWANRKDHFCKFIRETSPDVVGLQEVLHNQLDDLKGCLPGYAFVGVGRDDGQTAGEYSPVGYQTSKFKLLDSGNFWLSDEPEVPGKLGWDAACTRIASWVKLQDKSSDKIFMVVNTHFDHVGTEARRKSALLIIDRIQEIVGENPAFFMGDLNVTDTSDAYKTITTNNFVLKDAHKIAKQREGVTYTFQNFGRMSEDTGNKIDFIFVTPHIQVQRSYIPSAQVAGELYLSDHNPQIIDVRF